MYEMFCGEWDGPDDDDSFGGDLGELEFIEGLPPVSANGGTAAYGITSDRDYVYIAHRGGKGLTVVSKGRPNDPDSWVVQDTPQLQGVSGIADANFPGVSQDDEFIYVSVRGAPSLQVLSKDTWLLLDDAPRVALDSSAGGIYNDAEYLYVGGLYDQVGGVVIRKSDWGTVASFTVGGGGIYDFASDENNVYLAHFAGSRITVIDKAGWGVQEGTPSLPGGAFGVDVDNDYVYIGHRAGKTLTVLRKSDWSIVPDTPHLGGASVTGHTAPDVYTDRNYVYVAHDTNFNGGFSVIRKTDWSLVEDTPNLPVRGVGVHVDRDYLYVCYANNQGWAAMGIPQSE